MLRLRTFGGLSVEQVEGPAPPASVTSARRRLALLAVLAASGDRGGGVSRDRLQALIWPESDGERARHSLAQALFSLKRELGSESLVLGRDELQLNPATIESDVGLFRAALAAGDRARAVEIYTGPFLDGVYLSGTGGGDFDRWVDEERSRLGREVEGALEALATEAASRGDHQSAARRWQRLAEMDPRRTRVVVALMTEMAAMGDRAGAMRQATIYQTLVKDDLEAEPNPAVAELVDRLKREPQPQYSPAPPPQYSPAAQYSPAPVPSTAPSTNGHPPGEAFAGQFLIERELGRGGTATVYLAKDVRNSRPVAVKILRPELAAGIAVERFRQEITVTANLQHPHILTVHESGEASGTLYFVMPFVEGESLRQLLDREKRLSLADAVHYGSEVADALMYAHRRGIVHRDIKPENILLTSGHAIVADFGLARALSAGSNVRRTLPGAVIGTPAYLSPEQASGEFEIDARSDQYSLAYVLYESLAGEPPFRGPSARDLMAQRLSSSPASLRTRRGDIPESIDAAILRALARNPADRFNDVEEFAQAITAGSSNISAAPSVALPLPAPPRSNGVALAAVALVIAAVLFGGWYGLLRRPAAGLATRAWVLASAFENRTGDSVFDGTLQAALTTGLEQSALVNVFPRSRIQQTLTRMGRPTDSKLDESLAREVAQREGIGAIVSGEIHRVDSTFMITARIMDPTSGAALTAVSRSAKGRTGVIEALDQVVRELRKELGESRSLLAKHDLPLPQATTRSLEGLRKFVQAKDAWNNGDRNQAMNLWQEATALDSDFALAHASLGGAYYWANDRPKGEEHFALALKLLDRLTDRERFQVRAQVEGWRGNREAAIDILKARLTAYPDDRETWGAIGYNYLRLNRDRDALDAYAKQLAIDSGSVTDLINIATAHKGLGQYEESLRFYERAFALQPSFRTLDNLNHEYGTTLVMAGKSKEARAAFTLMLSGTPESQAMGHRSLGMLDELEGRFDDAIGHFRQAAVLSQARQRPLSEARNRVFLAMALRDKGHADSARMELDATYALFRKNYFEPTFLWYMGKALVAGGQVARAKELLDSLTRRASNSEDRRSQLSLQGEIALSEGRATAAMSALQTAYATDSSLLVQETLARALAASGDLAGATRTYESLVASRGHWFGWEAQIYALLAGRELGGVLERMGDVPRARQAYERLLSQWSAGPDTGLVAVREARARLAAIAGTNR